MKKNMTFSFIFIFIIFTQTICRAESKADWPNPVMDQEHFGLLLFDLLEYKPKGDQSGVDWDIVGWRGSDKNRIWVKSEGSAPTVSAQSGEADLQVLYGKLISAYFDAQIGARLEQTWGNKKNASRVSAAFGLQGLSLYIFEFESALFIGSSGYIAGRISANKDFRFTQKAIAQFRFETNAAGQRSEEFETGSGINDLVIGLRLRYEFEREFAPYIGGTWAQLYGDTANYRTLSGEKTSEWNFVTGLRMWF